MHARLLILANLILIVFYVVWQGVENFCYESVGTWIISPVIYGRLCPDCMRYWYLSTANSSPMITSVILCGIPVIMCVVSLVLGFLATRKGSLTLAVVSCLLMTTVFVTYHSVKHMGIKVERYNT